MRAPVFVCEGRFEARFATELVTGFSDSVVPPAGCPRATGAARFRCVAPLLACCAGKRLRVSSASHPVGFESRHIGSKKPATELVTGFTFQMVPPAGCPRAAGAARFRCVAPLLACCAGKRLRVSSASHPVGFESRHIGSKKPATARVTGSSIQMVPPAGFEPAISTLKGWRPWPLDDGDSGKEYSRLF